MMRSMPLADVLLDLVEAVPAINVTGLSLDNRRIQPGMAFVALRGTCQHGLQYAAAAVEAGASVVLYELEDGLSLPSLPVPLIPVPRLRASLGSIAERFYHAPTADLFMVGVTGTDGKTSITHFVAEALNALEPQSAAVMGTIGIGEPRALRPATHTTPDALTIQGVLRELRDEGFQCVAMEVSSHALDQGRVNKVRFDVAVLSNLTRDHLDYHGTVEAYAAAKRRLFEWEGLRALVLNRDDAFGQRLAADLAGTAPQIIGYAVGNPADYPANTLVATDAVFDHAGIRAKVTSMWGEGILQAPVLGKFNLHNLLAALGVLLAKGLPMAQALACLQHVRVVPGRMERVTAPSCLGSEKNDGKLVVVDYAHTPGALQQVLTAARVHTRGRLLCVFGCGGDRDRGKRPLMAQVVEINADVVIVTDDNPRTENPYQIFEDIMQGFTHPKDVTFEHDRTTAIRLAIAQAQPGDTVLIAGKGHETVQILANRTIPFDDREQAARALQECAA